MKKLIYSLCLLTALPIYAGEKKTFTAACLNVDGLPPYVKVMNVADVKLNPEGPQEAGATQIGKLVAQKGWDFVALSEAFNYNKQILESLNAYSHGTDRGGIPTSVGVLDNPAAYALGNKWFDTDGLNLLWRSNIEVSGEAWTLWDKRNGTTKDGADQMIAKGYRYYCVTIAPGMSVDVYIHHMDAETTPEDNAAREVQMNQLVTAIKNSNNKRPIIIMGDTNCRYTRDRIKEIIFDQLNADPRFTVHDPWIDFSRKGVYPSVGSGAIMVNRPYTGTEESFRNFQEGEVVDKIWWIENTDSPCSLTAQNYLHDTDFTWPDGSEISDHYPIVIDFEIEKVRDEVTSGIFYLRNVKTDKWMAAGHTWGTRGIVDNTGFSISLEPVSGKEDTYYLSPSTMYENNKGKAYLNNDLYMDGATPTEYEIKLVPGTNYVTLKSSDKNVATNNDDNLYWADPDINDSAQQWEMVAQSTRINQLNAYASESNPMNATFLLKGYSMARNDKNTDSWANLVYNGGSANTGLAWDANNFAKDDFNSSFRVYNGSTKGEKSKFKLSHEDTNLPNGAYKIECQIFCAYYTSGNITFNGVTKNFVQGSSNGSISAYDAGKMINDSKYKVSAEFLVTDHKLTIDIEKVSEQSKPCATYFDNFYLTYLGPTADDLAALDRVKAAIDDAQSKADNHTPKLTEYNNKGVVNAWENRLITGNGDTEIHNTYIALGKAATKQRTIPAEMSYAILNNSFEMGNTTEWDVSKATASAVKNDGKATDGSYYFEGVGTISYPFEITMPNGLYELTADLTPGTTLEVNGLTTTAEGTGDMVNTTIRFMISAGTATVKVSNPNTFKADNFQLTRKGDYNAAQGFEMISLAIQDATDRINKMAAQDLASTSGWAEKMAPYQTMVDEMNITGNGQAEFLEIYELLRSEVFKQPMQNLEGKDIPVNYTNAIINNSFEFGKTYGWDLLSTTGDTGVKENSNKTYTMSGCDGLYVFNTWNSASPTNRGTIISQQIKNLPAGHYELKATFATDKNNYVFLEVVGQSADGTLSTQTQREMFKLEHSLETGEVKTLQFDVKEPTTVIIRAGGCNNNGTYDALGGDWYKVDNFVLTRTGEADGCFFYQRLKAAIDDANAKVNALPEKYKTQWDANRYKHLYDNHMYYYHNQGTKPEDDLDLGDIIGKDPMDGNGLSEINALYKSLRELIFKQTETGADMTGAITNNSFQLGDPTGWTCTAEPGYDAKVVIGNQGGTYGTTPMGDGDPYLFNCWNNDDGRPIYQILPNVPAGKYTLTVKLASFAGNKFFIGANKNFSEVITIPAVDENNPNNDIDKTVFHDYSLTFTLENPQDVKIGIYPCFGDGSSVDDSDNPTLAGPWYKVDDFRLILDSRYLDVNWKPEYADCGTIMLPFALTAQEYQEYLGQYGFNAYYIDHLAKNETPADIERNLYRIIKLSDPLTELEANKPYLLRKSETETVAVRSVKAAAPEDGIYHIYGWSENKNDQASGEHKILEGSLVEYKPHSLHYHLQQDELGNVGFVLHDGTKEEPGEDEKLSLDGYHALITVPITPEGFAQTDGLVMQGYYFKEPVQEWKLVMEAGQYGTLVLPFEAKLPEGLDAKQLIGVSEQRNAIGHTYQLAQWTDNAVTTLKANEPYVVKNLSNSGKTEYTFTGVAGNDVEEFSPEGNLLTGLFKSRDGVEYNNGEKKRDLLEAGHWILMHDEETGLSAFVKTSEETELKAYNAYILNPEVVQAASVKGVKLMAEKPSANPSADVIYLTDDDAKQTYEWEMKGPGYDAIILPFDADVPEGLEAYTLTGAENEQIWPKGTKTYQVLEKTKADKLEANKAYLLVKAVAEDNNGVDTQADDNVYTFTGTPNADASQTNGLLKGTFDDITVNEDGSYLIGEEADKEFARIEDGRGEKVTALHAYIPASNDFTAQYLVLKDPKDEQTGVTEIMEGDVNVDIYTLDGVMVRRDVKAAEALQELDHGIYILRSAKGTVKVIK